MKEASLAEYNDECCPDCGIHPSAWDPRFGGDIRKPKVVPEWQYCRICDLVEQARAAGPKAGKEAKGYHLGWMFPTYD